MFICSFKPRDLVKRLGLVSFLILVTVLAILYLKQPNKRLPFPASGLSEEHNTHAADNAASHFCPALAGRFPPSRWSVFR